MRWLSILVLAVALVAAGCGGDDDSSSASDDTTIEEATTEDATTEDTTTDEETTTDETTDLSGVLDDEDCLALASAGSAFAQAFTGTSSDADTEAFQELADNVPDEIKADVQVLAEAFATYSEELQDIGIQAGATPTAEQLQQLQAALASIDQAEVTAASERLGTWAEENCSSG